MSKYMIREALSYDMEFKEKWDRLDPDMQQYYLDVQDGKRTISFYNDVVFKKLLDPDTQKKRLSTLLSLIIGRKVEVLHSIRNESTLTSVYSKKSILDISAILDGGEYVDLEMQVLSERYTGERAAVYSCDLVNRQYSVNQDEKKSTVNFGSVRPVYSITMLKQSPEEFLTNNKYIHKFQQISDSGLRLNLLQKYYFIELNKYQLQHAGTTPDTLLDAWIAFVGTDSIKTRLAIMDKFPEFQEVNRELIEMSFDRKELMYMTDHNLELMERNTLYYSGKMEGIQLGKLEGIQLGKLEGQQEGMQAIIDAMKQAGMTPEEIKKIVGLV